MKKKNNFKKWYNRSSNNKNSNLIKKRIFKAQSIGCMIDLDGVIWHGGVPFHNSKKALNVRTIDENYH